MKIVETIDSLQEERKKMRGVIGLVPTMGFLHRGHGSLIKQARAECDYVIVSVFVNPLQFGPNEDFDRYPRDLQGDLQRAEEEGTDLVFAPTMSQMYPEPVITKVIVAERTNRLCGASRPGHFDGVGTVVAKLFHIVAPNRAYFGQKDAQQLAVIQQMTTDLNFPVTVVACPTLREEDGLAMSSRNVYLTEDERKQAPMIYQSLVRIKKEVAEKQVVYADEVRARLRNLLAQALLGKIDYVDVLQYPQLRRVTRVDEPGMIAAVAMYFGQTRLIDNIMW